MVKLLLAEDNPTLGPALCDLLKEEHFEVTVVPCGDDVLAWMSLSHFDLVILDVMLPGLDGFSILRTLRERRDTIPVLMLTARDSVADRVKGLEFGADDYLVKPFAATELVARIRALLRRASKEFADPELLTFGELKLHVPTRELTVKDQTAILPPKESLLLELFLRHPGIVLTRSQLMDRLWGFEGEALENTLEAYISRLRKRLEYEGCPTIHTIRGLGYRFQSAN